MIWKFRAAPPELQALHEGATPPQWVALIPAAIHGPDLQAAILAHSQLTDFAKYTTEGGDIVYLGSSDVKQLLELVGNSWADSGGAHRRSQIPS
jgi:hypothetical protein